MIYSISQGYCSQKIASELILNILHPIKQLNYVKNPNNVTYYLRCSDLKNYVYMYLSISRKYTILGKHKMQV